MATKIWVNIGSGNVDLSSKMTTDVQLRVISLVMSRPSVIKISLKIIFLRFYWNHPGANELSYLCYSFEDQASGRAGKWNLRVHDLQMSCRDLMSNMTMMGYQD